MLTVKDRKFYLDGEEFKLHSGSFHYFRALPEYWEDILIKIKGAGFNCVETYTCWNAHEPKKGQFNFTGMFDLEKFIETADKVGLKVLLRTGPFICGEWENGGFPSWLLKDRNIRLRCNSEPYMTHLRDWFKVLLGKIRPHLDSNGGPVIAVAVENEYGSFGDDFEYLRCIRDMYREAGIDCLLFAADGAWNYYFCTGKADENIIQGTDFAPGVALEEIKRIDYYDPTQPYFAAEYWAGNYTCWGEEECHKDSNEKTKKDIDDMLSIGASFNIYMLYGGTNFGFYSGANKFRELNRDDKLRCMTTSYDYDSAITEWGGYTRRYFDMKESLERDNGKPSDVTLPPSPKFQNIGEVVLTESGNLFDNLDIGKKYFSVTVENMEHYDQSQGYILYRKVMDYNSYTNHMYMENVHDRAYVYLNGKLMGIQNRYEETPICFGKFLEKGDVIEILVENMGRFCFGEDTYLGDRKGILGGVFFHENNAIRGKCVFNWEVNCLEMDDLSGVKYKPVTETECPAFFRGSFKATGNDGCFIHFDNFKKGFICINGFNLGRYWEEGPQTALYLPGALLKEDNEIVIFEAEGLKGKPSVILDDKHGLGDHNEEVIVK